MQTETSKPIYVRNHAKQQTYTAYTYVKDNLTVSLNGDTRVSRCKQAKRRRIR